MFPYRGCCICALFDSAAVGGGPLERRQIVWIYLLFVAMLQFNEPPPPYETSTGQLQDPHPTTEDSSVAQPPSSCPLTGLPGAVSTYYPTKESAFYSGQEAPVCAQPPPGGPNIREQPWSPVA